MLEYELGSIVEMKKPHACTVKATGKKANAWEITRLGADIKIRCTNCNHEVMMSRFDFNKKIKKCSSEPFLIINRFEIKFEVFNKPKVK